MKATRGGGRRVGEVMLLLLLLLAAIGPVPLVAQQVTELPGADRALSPELEHVYTVGSVDGAPWEIFGELTRGSLAFDGGGNLHVFDRQNDRVVVVGPGGEHVRELGRRGEGPGEWRMPLAFTVLRDGTVLVVDAGHRSMLRYGPGGEYLESVPLGMEDGSFSFGGMHPDPRGDAVIMGGGGGVTFSMRTDGAGSPELPTTRPVERVALDGGGTRTTVFEAWKPPAPEGDRSVTSTGGGIRLTGPAGPRRFEPGLHVGVLPDGGLAVVDSSTWSVKLVGSDGGLRRVLRRPFRPREVTRRIQEEDVERRLNELETGEAPRMRVVMRRSDGGTTSLPEEQVREMQRERIRAQGFYPEIPVVDALAAGWGGTLWVQRSPDGLGEERGPLDVVAPSGAYLGTIPPDGMALPVAFGPDGLVAHIERDELDVPTVVVRRLPEALR